MSLSRCYKPATLRRQGCWPGTVDRQ